MASVVVEVVEVVAQVVVEVVVEVVALVVVGREYLLIYLSTLKVLALLYEKCPLLYSIPREIIK